MLKKTLPLYKRLQIPMGKSVPYSRVKQIIQWSKDKGLKENQ
jgi:hypothetical protein